MMQEAEVVVIGMGPSGEHAAGRLAEAGLDVVGVEAELVGGECPYWACVPSKMMTRATNQLAEAWRMPSVAGPAHLTPDFGPVATRLREEATGRKDQMAVDGFTCRGGRFVRGRGRLAGPGRVEVDGMKFNARHGIVLATGTRPRIPLVPGLETTPYWTSRDKMAAKGPPASLIVLGGGAVGLEHAQVFARFGTAVTVVEAQERLLLSEEPEASELLAEVLQAEAITIHTGVRASEVRHAGNAFTLSLGHGEELYAQQLLVATGRRANLAELGLETVGLHPDAGALPVDEQLLAAPRLWGVGDVTERGRLMHMAVYQAETAVRAILGEPGLEADYGALPRVTFTDPEVGSVGLTEQQAREAGLHARTGLARVPSPVRGSMGRMGSVGLVKLVADVDRRVLVGATSVGPAGGGVLYGLAAAVQAEVPVDRVRNMIYTSPAIHKALEDALAGLC